MHLSDSEWIVMDVLWENSSMTLSELRAQLNTENISWTANTIQTFLVRLEKKGIVEIDRYHIPYLYRPLKERSYFEKQVLCDVKQRIFHGSLTKMISAFIQDEKVSQEELEVLKKLVDQRFAEK